MGGSSPTHLISLADGEGNSVTVSILGRNATWTAGLDAEIVVGTPFVSGRLGLTLSVRDLDGWSAALREMSRGPSLSIQLTGERECPEVVVEDEGWSMVTVRVPLVPPDDWIADHHLRLRRVMDHWVPMLAG
ncbi:DUF5959 family protein [Streptomyces cyaneofuscatus]